MLVREREFNGVAGLPVLLGGLVAVGGLVWGLVTGARGEQPALIIGSAVGLAVVGLLMAGLFMVNPNEGRVLQLFGNYAGTDDGAADFSFSVKNGNWVAHCQGVYRTAESVARLVVRVITTL